MNYKILSEALGVEWDGTEYEDEGEELFDNYVPYGGGGKGNKNGHFGCRHTDEAKKIMRYKKLGKTPWNKNVKGYLVHTEQSKKQMSEKLSGSNNGRSILNEENVDAIIQLYLSKPELEDVGKVQGNGLKMSYVWSFSNRVAAEYGTTPAAIKRIILKKNWKNVWQKYEV